MQTLANQTNTPNHANKPLVRVNKGRRCPVCDHDNWCSFNSRISICMRIPSDRFVDYSTGARGYIHFLSEPVKYNPQDAFTGSAITNADPDHLDRVYRRLLNNLHLTDAHRDSLKARGLSSLEIKRIGYRSLPKNLRNKVVQRLLSEGLDLTGVPGFTQNSDGEWLLCGKSGILIPYANLAGNVIGLQIEIDDRTEDDKYHWLSSAIKGGWGPGTPINVVWPLRRLARTVYITEGGYKPMVTAERLNALTLGLPGADNWRGIIPILRGLKPNTVIVALDVDANVREDGRPNQFVQKYERDMTAALKSDGYTVLRAIWDEAKGPDDALVAQKPIQYQRLNQKCAHCREELTYMGLWASPTYFCFKCGGTGNPLPAEKVMALYREQSKNSKSCTERRVEM